MVTATRPCLVTIPISHYCEAARWALDRAGVDYDEDGHLPALAVRHVRRAGGERTTPILVANGESFASSGAILRYADRELPEAQRLLPDDPELRAEHEALEQRLDQEFGPHVRRYGYALLLPEPASIGAAASRGVPAWESRTFALLRPLFLSVLKRTLRITPESTERSRVIVERFLDDADERLERNGGTLCGGRFGLADHLFCALAAPVVLPPNHPGLEYWVDQVPQGLRDVAEAVRARPSGRFVLEAYARRRQSAV